ncbi:PREDICTED: uncharacterized protein LOC105567868, partial [Vollenhovia emeryi]|uniref:uncharacterized protein LOC105567868 n=1 Tax=Vollenhovia emeryi TaxID=411798 RepID=UPI0005F3B4A8
MSTANTILVLDEIFATFGYPKYLVSDNGRTFIAKEFKNFLEKRGVKLKLTAPYHLLSVSSPRSPRVRSEEAGCGLRKEYTVNPYTISAILPHSHLLRHKNPCESREKPEQALTLLFRNILDPSHYRAQTIADHLLSYNTDVMLGKPPLHE